MEDENGKIVEIGLKEDVMLIDILDEYVTDMKPIPTEEGKRYFRDWNYKVPPKLIRQCLFAGMLFALKHPDQIEIARE